MKRLEKHERIAQVGRVGSILRVGEARPVNVARQWGFFGDDGEGGINMILRVVTIQKDILLRSKNGNKDDTSKGADGKGKPGPP